MTAFKQQEFRVRPKDVNAREGTNVTLSCEINYVTGDVQWTKDGLALGRFILYYIRTDLRKCCCFSTDGPLTFFILFFQPPRHPVVTAEEKRQDERQGGGVAGRGQIFKIR